MASPISEKDVENPQKLRESEASSSQEDAILQADKEKAGGNDLEKSQVPHAPTLGATLHQLENKPGEKIELTEDDCYDQLGYAFPSWKKWMIISVIFLVQTSMNFNTSLYSNALTGISEEFNVSMQAARCGAMIFLVLYAFGCELWAPWSEEVSLPFPVVSASFEANMINLDWPQANSSSQFVFGQYLAAPCGDCTEFRFDYGWTCIGRSQFRRWLGYAWYDCRFVGGR
jgi:hypothetical protein